MANYVISLSLVKCRMVNARENYGNAYGVFISPEGWWTLAGGNTPGNRPAALRPEGARESITNCPIRPIRPIRPIPIPHPQTHPHPKSTLTHPKSTVDLGYEPLIKVKNDLRPPLSPTCYRPKSGPKIKESNQNQTATHQKIYSAFPPFSFHDQRRVSGQNSPPFSPSYSNLFHSMPTYSTHLDPPRFLPGL